MTAPVAELDGRSAFDAVTAAAREEMKAIDRHKARTKMNAKMEARRLRMQVALNEYKQKSSGSGAPREASSDVFSLLFHARSPFAHTEIDQPLLHDCALKLQRVYRGRRQRQLLQETSVIRVLPCEPEHASPANQ